jgi:Mn-dependent DtxR family transcriptional regulator
MKRPRSPFRPKAPPRPATARQSDFLDAIRELAKELGRAPTATDIAERVGVSRQGAIDQLRNLEKKGLVQDMPKLVSSGQWQVTEEE